MAITFPASPSDGDVFTNSTTGVKYIYNATDGVWKTHVWPTNTNYLQLSGGTLTGDLSLGTNDLTAQDITTTGAVSVGTGLTVGDAQQFQYNTASTDSRTWHLSNDVHGYGDFAFRRSTTQTGSTFETKILFKDSGGICFNGDTAAANALDDYEEGTWTPVDSGGNQFTLGKAATYTKVGRVVYLSFDITGNASASGFAVYGLPFGALNVTSEGGNFCFYPGYTAGINQDVFGHTGPDNVTLFVATANETVHNGDRLIMSGWYFTNE